MGKSEKEFLEALGILLLGKILIDALKKYRCPRCNYPVSDSDITCPNCGQPLIWRGLHD
ncbi:zinc ribbon domain-containing protein [Candidatus Micrarchaeota archaeon]|nr:zinc ribbon domain-containing protein [Candidatus Micrarchaeota archaeon]